MKLQIPCNECAKEGLMVAPYMWLDVVDDGRYHVRCSAGHISVFALQQMKFELLFELGIHAIADGYPREAIASFASSLERFYEFSIRVLTLSKAEAVDVEAAWKPISNSSERQLGAFIFTHLSILGSVPRIFSTANTELRNRVVHKGLIPTKEQAIKFGEAVRDQIVETLANLRAGCPTQISQVVGEHVLRAMSNVPAQASKGTYSVEMTLSVQRLGPGPTVAEAVRQVSADMNRRVRASS